MAVNLCSDGDLLGLLRKGALQWGEILRAAIDVCDAMVFLSSTGFVHRDLACRNVFVGDGCAKVGDFGLSMRLEHSSFRASAQALSGQVPLRWTAPEAMLHVS